jgi:hypothetical protein
MENTAAASVEEMTWTPERALECPPADKVKNNCGHQRGKQDADGGQGHGRGEYRFQIRALYAKAAGEEHEDQRYVSEAPGEQASSK